MLQVDEDVKDEVRKVVLDPHLPVEAGTVGDQTLRSKDAGIAGKKDAPEVDDARSAQALSSS